MHLSETIPNSLVKHLGKIITARIRYRQPLAECVIESLLPYPDQPPVTDRIAHVRFTTPQRAVAPGQFIAFYDGEELIGSGVIAE